MVTSEFSHSGISRMLKKAGAERISNESSNELGRILEEIGESIAKHAVEMSMHAGRKTIKAEDIRLATKQFTKF